MKLSFLYLRTWLIIKRKQILNLFPAKNNAFIKFAILCSPRSGSTWLHTLLNSHPHILSHGEILREYHEKNKTELPPLSSLVFHPHHSSIRAVGLKIFYEYERDPAYKKSVQELITDPTIQIIHLVRNDKQAQFESLLRAQKSQQWSSGKAVKKPTPVAIHPDELDHYQNEQAQAEKKISRLLRDHSMLTIHYETLRDDQHNTCRMILDFLNTQPRKLFSLLHRQSETFK